MFSDSCYSITVKQGDRVAFGIAESFCCYGLRSLQIMWEAVGVQGWYDTVWSVYFTLVCLL